MKLNLHSKFKLLTSEMTEKISFSETNIKLLTVQKWLHTKLSDKRKLLFAGSRYFCPIKISILEKLELFSMTCEDKSSSITDISSSVNGSV